MKCRFNLKTLHCLESQLLATQTCVQLRDALTSIAEHQLNPHRLYRLRLNIARYFLVRRTTISVGSGCRKKKKKVVFNKSSGSATLRFALGVSGHKQCRHFFEAKLDKWSVGSKPTLCLEGHGFKYLRGYRPFCHHGLTQTFQTGVAIVPRIRPRALPRPSEYITD